MNNLTDKTLESIRFAASLQLWQLGAVKVNLNQPFKLAAGNYSPIYMNCRQLISSVAFVDLFVAAARLIIESDHIQVDFFGGGETAGIPFAAFLARAMGKPMIYVRKVAKDHGLASLIEGNLSPGSRVVLVEDLITDAGSKLHFIGGISAVGGGVGDVLVVFDRQQGGGEVLKQKGIALHAVTNMEITLEVGAKTGMLSPDALAAVHEYLTAPKSWHNQRQLPYQE